MIVLCSFRDLDKYKRGPHDFNYAIVRNLKDSIGNVQQFTRLAPSQGLYETALLNKHSESFWPYYHKAFCEELKSYEKQVGLALLEDMVSEGYEINLLCYCEDKEKCHRLDVYNALKSRGIECELY